MKKILFSVTICFFCVCGACFAACNSPTTIAYDGNQELDDDEFLYPDESNYLAAKHGYENTKHKTSGDGKAYECDKFNAKVCGDGDRVTLPAGHYFGGQKVDVKTTYECYARSMWNDVWKPVSKDVCSTPVYGDIKVGKQYSKHLTKAECSGYTITDHNGVEFALICRDGPTLVCKAVKCIEGMRADNGKCVAKGGNNGGGNNGGNNGTPSVCSQNDLSFFNQWEINCASHAATINLITQIKALCASGKATAKQYNDLYVKLTASVAINCPPTVVIEEEIKPDNSQARAAIISAGGVLDSIVAGLDTSKWKNEEGKFNTARLASDSIAGVVLGTAGGLITSSVVKKNQIENGFEDMRCTVGGQAVADWGDEFSVGRK